MDTFVGRKPELERLSKLLKSVKVGSSEPGKAIAIRGRRRVGKSRMVAEFTERAGVPAVFFTATHGDTAEELQRFAAEVGRSNLPNRDLFSPGQTWEEALRFLALILPRDRQSIVVLDEVPYLMREDKRFEGMLQAVWDRVLNRLPVLLILIGSNRSEMERLTSYDRPFHLRGTEMELGPLSVSDVASFTGLGAADAIDAFAVTGGQPLILAQWESGMTLKDFIRESIADPLSALLVSGERVLTAEFPTDANANGVLRAIGAGEATFTSIANSVGMSETTLQRSLDLLADRRMIVVERPLATSASRNTRYRIEDPYLRFWLAFLADQIPTIEAGRSNLVIDAIKTRWLAWRGRAIEPIIRDLLWRSYGITPPAAAVGGWWNRSNSIEIDLIGADRAPVAHKISYVGSIKWRESHPFGSADLAALVTASEAVPGAANAPYLAVSRTGFDVAAANLTTISPDQLVGS